MIIGTATLQSPYLMDAGTFSPLVDDYARALSTLGYAKLTVEGYSDPARHFLTWLSKTGLDISSINDRLVARFARHPCRCGGNRRCARLSYFYLLRVRRFLAFLADRRIIKAITRVRDKACCPQLDGFEHWLEHHRGLARRTAQHRCNTIRQLLPRLGHEAASYDAALLRQVVIAEANHRSPSLTQAMLIALRSYLRFLAAMGRCRPGLEDAVPPVAQWRLSVLPRYLLPLDVERVIASCDLSTAIGIRDRAILLLFARLGLRGGDVLDMRIDDIDWMTGTLMVSGKSRQGVRLPLPQDAGDAILAYIDRARPAADDSTLFLRTCPPFRRLASSATLSGIVSLALERAGIKDPPTRGANLLRHSAATALLRGGATLQAVGAVLRHRSLNVTAHYAKVDIPMLMQIAQPWPGDVSC